MAAGCWRFSERGLTVDILLVMLACGVLAALFIGAALVVWLAVAALRAWSDLFRALE